MHVKPNVALLAIAVVLAVNHLCGAEASQASYQDRGRHRFHKDEDHRKSGYGQEDFDEYDYKPYDPERGYGASANEFGPDGEIPQHLVLRLLGEPVGHAMNMSVPAGASGGVDERHAPVMIMYDMWCQLPRDPPYGEAVPVPHVGHFHVTYKPAHHQKPWRLWGQTVLNIGKISTFELAHLNDDNNQSLCATFFNNDTVITPLNDTPIYNMLIKPKYPVNMQYVLDSMRMYPIPPHAASSSAKPDDTQCRIAQVIWGRLSITTKVDGRSMVYVGTLHAVPELDMTGTMAMRRSESETGKVIESMCGDDVVRRAVPWFWEFDLKRVEPSNIAAELGQDVYNQIKHTL